MVKIAAYAIMRNEERNVPDWWSSVQEADVMCVLDTGSKDNTAALLQDFGVKVGSLDNVESFHFGQARNEALALVPDDVDLCLWLDADERLTPGWREEIEADPDHRAMQVLLDSRGGQAWRTHPRIAVHARHGYRWHYPVHEMLVGPAPTRNLDVRVLTDNRFRTGHDWLHEMRQALRSTPDSPRLNFYLGRDLAVMGQKEEATAFLEHSLLMGGGDRVRRSEAMRLLHRLTGRRDWLERSIAELPGRREPWVDKCLLQYKWGERADAISTWNAAAARSDPWLWTTFPYAWDEPFQDLGWKVGALR